MSPLDEGCDKAKVSDCTTALSAEQAAYNVLLYFFSRTPVGPA